MTSARAHDYNSFHDHYEFMLLEDRLEMSEEELEDLCD